MDLIDQTAHLALAYVEAVKQQGHTMTPYELEAYVAARRRWPGVQATPPRTVTSTNVGRVIQQMSHQTLDAFRKAFQEALEPIQEERPGKPGVPAEPVVDWLSRLGWIAMRSERVEITKLGEAMLAHFELETLEEEIPVAVVLNQGDQLASARVIQKIAELGPCAVVDPYFSIESLIEVLQLTEVHRVLTGTKDAGKLAGLAAALGSQPPARLFEVRKSATFHDRFVIPDDGPLLFLGTSFTGFGKQLSLMVQLGDEKVESILRAEFERSWQVAEPIQPLLEAGEEGDGGSAG